MSSEAKFTKGPWSAESPYSTMFMIVDGQQQAIAEIQCGTDEHSDYVADEKEQANAHLIAAAPELYAALCDTMLILEANGVRFGESAQAKARKALAKARGEI